MSYEADLRAQEAAMLHPEEALKALRITHATGDSELYEVFMKAYEDVSAGSASNSITQSNVAAAVRDWKIDKEIPQWLARACVIANKQAC